MEQPVQYVDVSVLNKERSSDFNKWVQEMEQMISTLDLYLAGQQVMRDPISGKTSVLKDSSGKKLCNDKGRQFIKARLSSYLNPNLYMSYIGDGDVQKCYQIDMSNFVCDMHLALEEFDMSQDGARRITSLVSPIMFFALRKAQTDKKFMYDSMNSSNQQASSEASNPWKAMARAIGMGQ